MPKFDPLEAFDGWELEEKLDHTRRILAAGATRGPCDPKLSADPPQGWPAPATASPFSPLTWVLTKLAVSAITCGGVLAAWWWIAERQDLIKPALASLVIGHLAWLGKWCCELRDGAGGRNAAPFSAPERRSHRRHPAISQTAN